MDENLVKFIKAFEGGFKLETRPFLRVSKDLGIDEEEVIQQLKNYLEEGFIRRIGVAVRPTQAGFKCNALVAWEVDSPKVEEVGKIMASVPEISHAYERECPPGWKYNFFTMIHATSKEHLRDLINELKNKCKLENFSIYRTVREFKKSSPQFFPEKDTK